MPSIKLNSNDIKICEKFSEDVYSTNIEEYKRRNQNDIPKIKRDIKLGKIAEIGVYKIFTKKGIKCTYPDFKIYKGYDKSFDSDLILDKYDVHVKGQCSEQAKRFSTSWLFQRKDKLTTKPTERDLITLCLVDDNKVTVKKILKADKVVNSYEPPQIDRLKYNKTTLYYETIKNISNK